MQSCPDGVVPDAQLVVYAPVPTPPAGMAAQGCGVHVRLSALHDVAVQVRWTVPAKPAVEQVRVHLAPEAVEPPAQEVVYALSPDPPLGMAAQGCGEHVRAWLLQLVAVQVRVTLPA